MAHIICVIFVVLRRIHNDISQFSTSLNFTFLDYLSLELHLAYLLLIFRSTILTWFGHPRKFSDADKLCS